LLSTVVKFKTRVWVKPAATIRRLGFSRVEITSRTQLHDFKAASMPNFNIIDFIIFISTNTDIDRVSRPI
jgi:hypothetical protein